MSKKEMQVPFMRPHLGENEIEEVVETLRSGWLTSGPRVGRFESDFAEAVNARHAVALNSCTAALHLAVEALNLKPGQAVLVPTMTFAATAEVVRYQGATPLLVDCDAVTLNIDLEDAERKLQELRTGKFKGSMAADMPVVGVIPVHVGGLMMNVDKVQKFAAKHDLWVVEDAAHAFPAAWRSGPDSDWQQCGANTSKVSCFSFYANKTITTGEGGMATTNDSELADRIRLMSLHGLSHNAWSRYSGSRSWDYRIIAPGFKYNLTDIAAAIGIHQLARAEQMRLERELIANQYLEELAAVSQLSLPDLDENRKHSWHLFPIRLRLDELTINRNDFMLELKSAGVDCSVHWRPLHLHPYYQDQFEWQPADFPVATKVWNQLISLPIFSGMHAEEIEYVARTVKSLCLRYSNSKAVLVA